MDVSTDGSAKLLLKSFSFFCRAPTSLGSHQAAESCLGRVVSPGISILLGALLLQSRSLVAKCPQSPPAAPLIIAQQQAFLPALPRAALVPGQGCKSKR